MLYVLCVQPSSLYCRQMHRCLHMCVKIHLPAALCGWSWCIEPYCIFRLVASYCCVHAFGGTCTVCICRGCTPKLMTQEGVVLNEMPNLFLLMSVLVLEMMPDLMSSGISDWIPGAGWLHPPEIRSWKPTPTYSHLSLRCSPRMRWHKMDWRCNI